MVSSQVDETPVSKPVCAIGRRGLPGICRDSKQRSCCNGVCEVHGVGSSRMSRRVTRNGLTGGDRAATKSECWEEDNDYI